MSPMSPRLLRPRASGSLDPRTIANLALWLDANDSATLFDATSGGSLVGANGAVARWEDKSGNNRHATQSIENNRPARRIASQNGRDGLEFDGSNDTLLTGSFATTRAQTVFVAHRPTIFGPSQTNFSRIVEWGVNAVNTILYQDFPPKNYAFSYASNVINNSGVLAATSPAILRLTADGATPCNFGFSVNGGAPVTSSNSFTPANPAVFHISSLNGTAFYFAQIVYEILLYTRELSAVEQNQVQSYLNSKWRAY